MIARLILLIFCLVPFSAHAETKNAVTPLTRLDAASKKMLNGLDHNQTLQFAAIRNDHGIIRAVEDTENKIDAASKSCSEHNPEFAPAMQKRVGEWKQEIDPVLTDARSRLETIIRLQNFAKPAETRDYLKTVDAAVAYKSRGVKTTPIVDKQECHKLLEKMDDTQDDLKKLLVENLGLNHEIAPYDDR